VRNDHNVLSSTVTDRTQTTTLYRYTQLALFMYPYEILLVCQLLRNLNATQDNGLVDISQREGNNRFQFSQNLILGYNRRMAGYIRVRTIL
jgi:hypothetical protein